ncbi:hypothetical protein ACFQUU_28750 [Herbaspirillum sp. GCM10030257]|uniref:hypothetical protein n=1 Tax=Herbaspirillum sp. GCM10030257 TaxID=3273393 RepID=UPI00360E65EE
MDKKHGLRSLTHALRRLHQTLVEVARRDHEKEWGAVAPGELLQLLTKHPGFEWLRMLSQLMASIDELIDQDHVGNEEMHTAYTQTRTLILNPDNVSSPFPDRYRDILQKQPLVVMEHAAVRRQLEHIRSTFGLVK